MAWLLSDLCNAQGTLHNAGGEGAYSETARPEADREEAMRLVWVAVGGAIGSACRYLLDGAVYRVVPATFPYGTFLVNATGCLIFGLLIGVAENRLAVGTVARSFVLIGILGGFTTFSSFTFETLQLARAGEWWPATVNVVGQVVIGLLVMWLGFVLTRAGQP